MTSIRKNTRSNGQVVTTKTHPMTIRKTRVISENSQLNSRPSKGNVSQKKAIWNLKEEITNVIEKKVATRVNMHAETWNLKGDRLGDEGKGIVAVTPSKEEEWNMEVKVAKVLETRAALGFDFNRDEVEIAVIMTAKEIGGFKERSKVISLVSRVRLGVIIFMLAMSWNVRGLGNKAKRRKVKSVVSKQKLEVLFIHESKLDIFGRKTVKSIGGYILSDFNTVLYASEKKGSGFNNGPVWAFNNFILQAKVVDTPLRGLDFTWSNNKESGAWARISAKSWEDQLAKIEERVIKHGWLMDLRQERIQILAELWKNLRLEELEWRQKSKIKWIVKGDRNYRFFHYVANGRRITNYIADISFEGVKKSEPNEVKKACLEGHGFLWEVKALDELLYLIARAFSSSQLESYETIWDLKGSPSGWPPLCFSFQYHGRRIECPWAWRFGTKDSPLWKQVICAKYGVSKDSLRWDWKCGTNSSSFTKAVGSLFAQCSTSVKILEDGVRVVVGRGDKAKLWGDVLLEGTTLNGAFPRIFALAVNKFGCIRDYWSKNGIASKWEVILRRSFFDWDLLDPVGIGGVLRNHLGKVCCICSANIGFQKNISAEILAIAKACELCVSKTELEGKPIVIVIDSKTAVSWINCDGFGNIDHAQIIYDIRSAMGNGGLISVIFNPRESNSYADQLAKQGSTFDREVLSWSDL
ncbi:hypothetical protein Dsin_019738 [Dipteronia sinensis]|uniref:RNase H type-1 domain-containing protein n=1 Tax=Dipteronia sinensis TaxID=43782 RepID=A0AAE0E2T8_9ROSI|nr:hypothetical protein Dsin_019738 [Dipteronia sinensis]